MAARLNDLVGVRSTLADEVLGFLERLGQRGLERHVVFRPEWASGVTLADFCQPARVIKEQEWLELEMAASSPNDVGRHGSEDRDYVFPTHEAFMRTNGRRPTARLLERVRTDRPIILRGEPGEGKTTALWLHVAKRCHRFRTELAARRIGTESPELLVPVVLPLGTVQAEAPFSDISLGSLATEYVLQICYGSARQGAPVEWLNGKVKRGEFELCLDALDELPSGEGQSPKPRDWLAAELALHRKTRILLTTRLTADDEGILDLPLRLRIVCFSETQAREYVHRYFRPNPLLGHEVGNRLRVAPGLRELAQLPLLLGVLCRRKARYPSSAVPSTRTELLSVALHGLMERGDSRRGFVPENPRTDRNGIKESVLRKIAWTFFGSEPRPMVRSRMLDVLNRQLHRFEESTRPQDGRALLKEYLEDGVLVPKGPESYGFVLRSFHEYCLAGWIACESPTDAIENRSAFIAMIRGRSDAWHRSRDWGDLKPLGQPGWRYVWPLVAGQMGASADCMLEAVWQEQSQAQSKDDALSRLCLAAETTGDIARQTNHGSSTRRWVDRVRAGLIRRLNDLGGDVEYRAACVKALGRIGDVRAREALIDRLGDRNEHPSIRRGCAGQLPHIGGARSRSALVAQLDDDSDMMLPGWCVMFLGLLGDERSRDVLIQRLNGYRRFGNLENIGAALAEIGDEPARDALIEKIDDPSAGDDVRKDCAGGLGKLGDERSREVLIRWLSDSSTHPVRTGWIRLETNHDIRSPGEELIEERETPWSVRSSCAEALGDIGDERARDTLVDRLNDIGTHVYIRGACAKALGHIDDDQSQDVLMKWLNDSGANEEIRVSCAFALATIGSECCRDALIDRLSSSEKKENVRTVCASALGRLDDMRSCRALSERLNDPETEVAVRKACAEALGRIAWRSHQTKRERHLPTFRLLSALGLVGSHGSQSALIERLNDPETETGVREACSEALGTVGDACSRDALIERLNHARTRVSVRIACTSALRSIGDELARDTMIERLGDSKTNAQVRQACAEALGSIGDERCRLKLQEMLKDPRVHQACEKALVWMIYVQRAL